MDNQDIGNIGEILKLFELRRVVFLLLGLFIVSLVARAINQLSLKIQEQIPSRRLLALQVATVLNFTVYIFGTITIIYAALRPPKELLLALGGSAAVAIGFALKDFVSSIVAGFILLFDRPFQVGDRVAYDDIYGEIVGIGLRTVRLNTLDDNLVTIPNSRFLTDAVSSGNAGALDMMVVVDFYLSIEADLERARSLITEVVSTSRYTYLKKPVSVTFTEKCDGELFWIELKVKAYVFDVRYEKAFQTDIVLRGNTVFRENKIARPSRALILPQQSSEN